MPQGLVAALVLFLALTSTLALAQPGDAPVRERELRDLRGRIGRLQAEIAAAEKSSGEAADALKESARAVSEAHRALFEVAERRKALEAELESALQRERLARSTIGEQEALAERLLRLQHQQRSSDRLRLILEGRDAATVARHVAYYGYIQRARAAAIGALRQRAEELTTLQAEAATRREELAENEATRAREAERLEKERATRAAVAARLAEDIAKGRREVGKLKRDEARLAKLVDDLARTLAARPAEARAPPKAGRRVEGVADASLAAVPFASLKGRLRLPVRGELMNRFGAPREEAGGTWKGLFIRSPTGETVRAVADGQVVYADWLRGFGNLLIVDHGKGFMSLYGHNEGLVRQVGEKVRSGDPIAHVGGTGSLPDSGLYFELRREGKPFDPMAWVAQ